MTRERKLLYAFGAMIIVGMIAAASFSLGVTIGEQGWTLQAPSTVGPGGPQPGEPGQARLPQGEPGQSQPLDRPAQPQPDLIGAVRHVTDQGLELETREGLRSVSLSDETRLVRRAGEQTEPARWGDLRRGVGVAVFGQFGGDGRTLSPRLVVILPPPEGGRGG